MKAEQPHEKVLSGYLPRFLVLFEIGEVWNKVSEKEDRSNDLCRAVPMVATSPMWLFTFFFEVSVILVQKLYQDNTRKENCISFHLQMQKFEMKY